MLETIVDVCLCKKPAGNNFTMVSDIFVIEPLNLFSTKNITKTFFFNVLYIRIQDTPFPNNSSLTLLKTAPPQHVGVALLS